MMNALLSLIPLLIAAQTATHPKHFIPLTDLQRKSCNQDQQCALSQSKDSEKYQILFTEQAKSGKIMVPEITIKNTKSGSTENFKLPTEQTISSKEMFLLYATDINADGYQDIALQSGLSNRFGLVYYYWVYNPKSKKFVFSNFMAPALRGSSNRKILALTSNDQYQVDANYKLIELPAKPK